MSIFNTAKNIEKIKFGEMFNIMRIIEHYRGDYSTVGLFFVEPEPDLSQDVQPDIPYLVRIPIGRDPMKDLNKEGDDCIRYIITQLQSLPNYQINTQENIPSQLLNHFNTCPSIDEMEVDSRFIKFNNNINPVFRNVAEQHELRRRFGAPEFQHLDRCGWIHFKFHTKLLNTFREKDLDCVHWFLPVELKEGWG